MRFQLLKTMDFNFCVSCFRNHAFCEEHHYRKKNHTYNRVMTQHRVPYSCPTSYSTLTHLFIVYLILILSISTIHCLSYDFLHFHHRYRQLGLLSSDSLSLESPDEDRVLRNTGSSPYHLLYDKHRIEPYFDSNALSNNITVAEGSAATYLPCRVRQLGDRTVSWIRRKDLHVLTVGKFTYTSDQRFQAVHMDNGNDWTLQIRYPQRKDDGIYECQISTLPKMSLFINLSVILAKSKIIGGPSMYINSGSTLNLTCVVNETPGPPDYIFWYHNGEVINYDSPRGIKVQTEKSAQTTSKLIINKSQPNDSGNYSCSPSNAEPSHIAVHVHSNGNPAASIQHGKRSARNFITSTAPYVHYIPNITIGLPIIAIVANYLQFGVMIFGQKLRR